MKTKILLITSIVVLFFSSCNDVLDRPQLTNADDNTYWVSENNVRLFMNEYYPYLFVGYNTNWGTNYTPGTGYPFSDDVMTDARQLNFDLAIPASVGNATPPAVPPAAPPYNDWPAWQSKYTGPTWNFYWVRKANMMIDRVESRMGGILNEEQQNHWIGVARFFRAMWYAQMVQVFGDVPYYDRLVMDHELDELYKPRTPRDKVMDAVYDDFKFALENVRLNDGDQSLNRDIVAGFVSRLMLVEGTWQKYHYNNAERTKKFLDFSKEASELLMGGKYDIVTDFRSLFGSEDLKGNKDCILFRHYSSTRLVTHSAATYSNLVMADLAVGANLSLVKSFICSDGKAWKNSQGANNHEQFSLGNLVKTRDPRFEATFYHKPRIQSKTTIFATKFISREGTSYGGVNVPAKFTATNNTNDYPIIRYSEILLNWIEAKAELGAVTQGDIDLSINKIRNRPLDAEAISKGVKKTPPMVLSEITDSFDPDRDADVSPLIWEIRRERRMEFFFEHSRIGDLRRWKKIGYMSGAKNPDILRSIWIDLPNELPELLTPSNSGKIAVINANGQKVVLKIVVVDGKITETNAADMIGYYSPAAVVDRDEFENIGGANVYLAPVGTNQINDYAKRGFKLDQTRGWGSAQ